MTAPPILIIDGLNLFFRHFAANPSMSNLGYHIGGAIGFLKNLEFLIKEIGPKKIIVVWEGGGSPRRRAIFADYKSSKRPKKLNRFYDQNFNEENLDDQMAMLVSLLNNTPVKQMYVQYTEADDIIGYAVHNLLKKEKCVIVSTDKDLLQLLNSKTIIWNPVTKKFINLKNVKEKFNVYPINMCTVRSFVGDPSDNLKGVKGVGFKTLVKNFPLLSENKFISIDEILNLNTELEKKSNLKIFANISEFKDLVKRNWKLMYLDTKNLSGTQIISINDLWEQECPTLNIMNFLKILNKYGANTYDANNLFKNFRNFMRS
jgi:5'-3' exonuclease